MVSRMIIRADWIQILLSEIEVNGAGRSLLVTESTGEIIDSFDTAGDAFCRTIADVYNHRNDDSL